MTVAIVGRALCPIHQDVVGFAEFFEFFFRVRVVRIFVGMKFDRELAIGALDLLAGRGALDAEDFVVIALVVVISEDKRMDVPGRVEIGNARLSARHRAIVAIIYSLDRSRRRRSMVAAADPSIDNRDAFGE